MASPPAIGSSTIFKALPSTVVLTSLHLYTSASHATATPATVAPVSVVIPGEALYPYPARSKCAATLPTSVSFCLCSVRTPIAALCPINASITCLVRIVGSLVISHPSPSAYVCFPLLPCNSLDCFRCIPLTFINTHLSILVSTFTFRTFCGCTGNAAGGGGDSGGGGCGSSDPCICRARFSCARVTTGRSRAVCASTSPVLFISSKAIAAIHFWLPHSHNSGVFSSWARRRCSRLILGRVYRTVPFPASPARVTATGRSRAEYASTFPAFFISSLADEAIHLPSFLVSITGFARSVCCCRITSSYVV